MPLEDLLGAVETLQARIEAHASALSGNETQTRYALIDPLLRALGWDTDDPSRVVPEYSASGGRADYALLGADGKPSVMVEAKRLNRPLQDGLSQSIAYCVAQGTPYFCVSDGRRWALYETFRKVPIDEKLITRFDLLQDPPAEVCLKALALWHPTVATGTMQTAERPVVDTESDGAPPQVPDLSPTSTEAGWISLAGQRPPQGAPKPIEVLCPTGEQIQVKNWHGLRRGVVQWLVKSGHLASADAKDPDYHQNAANEVKRAEANIKIAKLDPADFKVRLAD